MPVKKYTAEVIENTKITKDVYTLKLKLDGDIEFLPGQFINIILPKDGKMVQKSYSIVSLSSQKDFLELCIKKIEGGYFSTYLHNVQAGDKFEIMGPFGLFIPKHEDDQSDAIFVATGTGISAIKPIIEYFLENKTKKQLYLIFGVRFEEDVYYRELFESLAKKHHNFHFIPTLSKPSHHWKGEKGYVQEWFKKHVKFNNQDVYICGLVPMCEELEKLCKEKGFSREKIHLEKYL